MKHSLSILKKCREMIQFIDEKSFIRYYSCKRPSYSMPRRAEYDRFSNYTFPQYSLCNDPSVLMLDGFHLAIEIITQAHGHPWAK